MTVLKLTEGLGLIEAGIKLYEDSGTGNGQQQLDEEL